MTAHRDGYFYVPPATITHDRAVITDGDEYRHLVRVLRKRPDDAISCMDGEGWIYAGRIEQIKADGVWIRIMDRRRDDTEPSVHLTLAPGRCSKETAWTRWLKKPQNWALDRSCRCRPRARWSIPAQKPAMPDRPAGNGSR